MKIVNKKLISIEESDLVNGHFFNDKIIEVADKCFYDIPSLKSVSLPAATTFGNYCLRYNAALTTVTFGKNTLVAKNVDGSCFIVDSEKTSKGFKIFTGYNFLSMTDKVINKENCFVAEKEGFYAHGVTVKKAISDLQFKIVAEKLKKEPIKSDTMLTVKYYRLLTGACDMGCRSWMEANHIPFHTEGEDTVENEPIRADELLPILEKSNAYGVEKIKSLITF